MRQVTNGETNWQCVYDTLLSERSDFEHFAASQCIYASDDTLGTIPMRTIISGLPAPARLATAALNRLNQDRVRAVLQMDKSWAFNYSITKLEAPDLAEVLSNWMPALESSSYPLWISGFEITFGAPVNAHSAIPDGADAFARFALACDELISKVRPGESTAVGIFWSSSLPTMISDCLNDWELDLDPIRDDVCGAAERLIYELDSWLDGIDRLIVRFELPKFTSHKL